LNEAIGWHIRLRDGGEEDWEAFVRWLLEDPDRSAAYDIVAEADSGLQPDAIPAAPFRPAANDDRLADPPARRPWPGRGWAAALAGAAAAFLLALIALPWLTADSGRYEIATRRGEQRILTIPNNGGSIALNGATRIVLDRSDPRHAELVTGEAAFTIRHDAARPFTLVAGDHQVRDAGTVFNVARDGGILSVEVAQGAIVYDPGDAALALGAGETLAVREADGSAVRGRRDVQAMAGWRHGQLSYKQAPLAAIARDLSRSIGMDVDVDSAIANQPFTGSIRIDRDPSETMGRLAATLDMQARRTGAGWRIEPSQRARR
jgi:transmembrane sensor